MGWKATVFIILALGGMILWGLCYPRVAEPAESTAEVPWHTVEKCRRFCAAKGSHPIEVSAIDCTCQGGAWGRM